MYSYQAQGKSNSLQQKQSLQSYNVNTQVQNRSPFQSVENGNHNNQNRQLNHKAATDGQEVTNRPTMPTVSPNVTNPYYNQFQQHKRASNSGHCDAKSGSKQQLQHSNSKVVLKPSHDYSIQFKVGQKNEKKNQDVLNETQLSQICTQTGIQNQHKQFTCMSPTQNKDHSMIYQSPMLKKELLQSPITSLQNAQSQSHLGMYQAAMNQKQSQQQINYTTTTAMQQELQRLQQENATIQQKTNTMEAEIQRGLQSNFMQQLEQKINLLNQVNEKLTSENYQLSQQFDINKQKATLSKMLQDRKLLQQQLSQIKSELQDYKSNSDSLQHELNNPDENESQIKKLVNELESKVSGLISENDRLNQQLLSNQAQGDVSKVKAECENLQKRLQLQKKEEESLRGKCDALEVQLDKFAGQNAFNDFQEKVQMLIDENERLNNVLTESEYTDADILDLKERIRIIKMDNMKMEKILKKK